MARRKSTPVTPVTPVAKEQPPETGAASAGQSGDLQDLPSRPSADSESVEELVAEGQYREAEIVAEVAGTGDVGETAADAENVEQSQETISAPAVVSREQLEGVHKIASQLIDELRNLPDGDLVGEIVANALKLMRDQTNRGDIKLINKSYKELRYALKIFAPYRDTRKVSIFGSARTPESHEDYRQAALYGK